jgi:heme/copper-type cytochrome/quinol oxidase subunit 2
LGKIVLQRLFAWLIVLVSILWIVVSYLPSVQAALPTFALAVNRGLAWLALAVLLIFIALQVWVVKTTATAVQVYRRQSPSPVFDLRLGREVFWTALPILMTVGLAWASLGLWRNLVAP